MSKRWKVSGTMDVRIDVETVVEADTEDEAREVAAERFSLRDELTEDNLNEEILASSIYSIERLPADKESATGGER